MFPSRELRELFVLDGVPQQMEMGFFNILPVI